MKMKTSHEVIKEFGKNAADSGASEVQIALLTQRIKNLSEHLKTNDKDYHSSKGLLTMVGQRRRLLDYLKSKNLKGYSALIKKLELRK